MPWHPAHIEVLVCPALGSPAACTGTANAISTDAHSVIVVSFIFLALSGWVVISSLSDAGFARNYDPYSPVDERPNGKKSFYDKEL